MAVNRVASTKNYASRIKVWAIVNGTELDVSSFRIRYAINEIPVGSVNFNLGINANTGKYAAIHALKNIDNQTKIEVWMESKPNRDAAKNKKIPNGKFKIFDGFTAGTEGFKRSAAGNIEFGVGVLGWLFDLNNSSILSSKFFADVPMQLFRTFNENPTDGSSGQVQYNISGLAKDLKDFTGDIWGTIKKVIVKLCSTKLITEWQALGAINTAAITAVNRFNSGKIVTASLAFEKIIKSSLLNQSMAANALSDIFSVQGLTGSSVWDKLLQLAATFQFYIIPNVESATCAPLIFQNKHIYETITADECFEIDIQASAPQQIAGLILVNSSNSSSTNMYSNPKSVIYPVFASDPKLVDFKKAKKIPGKILIREVPHFFKSAPVSAAYANATINSQKVDGKGLAKAKANDEEGRKRHDEMMLSKLGNQIATNWFYNELYKGRIGSLIGPLRLDIGPGSSVKLSGIGERVPNSSRNIYSCVSSVTLNFNAEPGQAYTQFTLVHCRSETEQNNALDKSPIYATGWNGTYLVKA